MQQIEATAAASNPQHSASESRCCCCSLICVAPRIRDTIIASSRHRHLHLRRSTTRKRFSSAQRDSSSSSIGLSQSASAAIPTFLDTPSDARSSPFIIMADKNNEQVVTETFAERSPFADGMTAGAASAGAGLLVSAIQNSIQTHNKGALGVFTRTGSTIALFSESLLISQQHPVSRRYLYGDCWTAWLAPKWQIQSTCFLATARRKNVC